jgi:hypothetical protein
MLLQLTGRLDPDETYAIIDLDGADLVAHSAPPAQDYVELELVNLTICHNPEHNHFEPFPPTAPYPVTDDGWTEKITIRVPRPMPLVHRRRTRFFTFPDDPAPMVQYVEDSEIHHKRYKRSPKVQPLTEYQVEYRGRFLNSSFPIEIAGVLQGAYTSSSKIVKYLHGAVRPRIERHFQQLLLSRPAFEIDCSDSSRRNFCRLKITLPAQTRFLCNSKVFYNILGFVTQLSEVRSTTEGASSKWGLVNSSKTDEKIFLSEELVETATIFPVIFSSKRINFNLDTVYFHFERHPSSSPNAYLTFAEEALCYQNLGATVYFFQLLAECVIQQVNLPRGSIKFTLKPEGETTYIVFSKDPNLESTGDTLGNFNIYARFGSKIAEKLGLTLQIVNLRLGGSQKLDTMFAVNSDNDETEVESEKCQVIINKLMREQFFNQTGGVVEITQIWQNSWQKIVNERNTEKQRLAAEKEAAERARLKKQQEAAEAERVRLKKIADEAEAEAERIRQQDIADKAEQARIEAALAKAKDAAERKRAEKEAEEVLARETKEAQAEAERVRQLLLQAKEDEAKAEAERVRQLAAKAEAARIQKIVDENVQKRLQQQQQQQQQQPPPPPQAIVEDPPPQVQQIVVQAAVVNPPQQQQPAVVNPPQQQPANVNPPQQQPANVNPPPQQQPGNVGQAQPDLDVIEEEEEEEEAENPPPQGDPDAIDEAPEEDNANDEEEEEEEEIAPDPAEEDPWMEIEIDNPLPRPAQRFIVANSRRPHVCTPPNTFPAYCTVLIKEGEPTDHVSIRGACSILGLIRERQPNIVSNKAIVKNIKNMKYLAIEFIDEAFNTFKLPADASPMFIKIDLKAVRTNVYY